MHVYIEHRNCLNHGFEHARSCALMYSLELSCALSALSCTLVHSHALSCALMRGLSGCAHARSCALTRSHALSVVSLMRAHALSCALVCSRVLSVVSRMRAHVLSCAPTYNLNWSCCSHLLLLAARCPSLSP